MSSNPITNLERPHLCVGFVGPTGAGKTTLAAIFVRSSRKGNSQKTLRKSFSELENTGRTTWRDCPQTPTDLAKDIMGYTARERAAPYPTTEAHYSYADYSTIHNNDTTSSSAGQEADAAAAPADRQAPSQHFFSVFDIPFGNGNEYSTVKAMTIVDVLVVVLDLSAPPLPAAVAVDSEILLRDLLVSARYGRGEVKKIIFALNKVDLVPADEVGSRIEQVISDSRELVSEIFGISESALEDGSVRFVPVCAMEEQNINQPPDANGQFLEKISSCFFTSRDAGGAHWTLLETLDDVGSQLIRERRTLLDEKQNAPFRMEILNSFRFFGSPERKKNVVVIGRVSSGAVATGATLIIGPLSHSKYPSNRLYSECIVRRIQVHRHDIQRADVGRFVGVELEPVANPQYIEPDDLIANSQFLNEIRYFVQSGHLLTESCCGGRIASSTITASVRFRHGFSGIETGDCLFMGTKQSCVEPMKTDGEFLQQPSNAAAAAAVAPQQFFKKAVQMGIRHPSFSLGEVFTVRDNYGKFGDHFIIRRNVPSKTYRHSSRSLTVAVGVVTSAVFVWDPPTVLNVNGALRGFLPFEITHLVLNFVLETPLVKLHS